jgi:hypothetical protein
MLEVLIGIQSNSAYTNHAYQIEMPLVSLEIIFLVSVITMR